MALGQSPAGPDEDGVSLQELSLVFNKDEHDVEADSDAESTASSFVIVPRPASQVLCAVDEDSDSSS